MKNVIVITALCLLTARLYAAEKENVSYVKANGKTYFGIEVRTGIFKTRVIASDGQKVKVQNTEIQSVMHDGRLFELMPVVSRNNKVIRMAMMEYITSKDGLRLYRYNYYNNCSRLEKGIITNTDPDDVFYVFRDGKFYLRIDESNAESALPFFGLNICS